MLRRPLILILSLFVPLVLPRAVGAQQPPEQTPQEPPQQPLTGSTSDRPPNTGTISTEDRDFIQKAGRANLSEVQLGQLALDRGTTKAVRDFAKRMVDDHTKANQALKKLADKKGMDLPSDVSDEQKAVYAQLSKLTGTDFDEAFMKQMASDHADAVNLFEQKASSSSDPAIQSMARKMLPTLKIHQRMAKQHAGSSM
jgi:putative membrane protein